MPEPSPRMQNVLSAVERVTGHAPRPKPSGGHMARCPAHDDRNASLSLDEAEDGRVLAKCHAGCPTQKVLEVTGLTWADLRPNDRAPDPPDAPPRHKPEAVHDYVDEHGEVLYQVVRRPNKQFRQRRPQGNGRWVWSLDGVRRIPYHLQEVRKAVSEGRRIWLTEGEKDADNLAALGLAATTIAGGASAPWRDSYSDALRGADVAIIPDNDEPGRAHAAKVAAALHGVAQSVRVLQLPGLSEKGDVSDWLEAGGSVTELEALADAVPLYIPTEQAPGPSRGNSGARQDDNRQLVVVGHDEHIIIRKAAEALARDTDVFQRGFQLVTVSVEELPAEAVLRAAAPVIRPLAPANTREKLVANARFVKLKEVDDEPCEEPVHPPQWLVTGVHDRGSWPGVRPLVAVAPGPRLLPGGRILAEPGYDSDTGLLLVHPCMGLSVPDGITKDDARGAVAALLELVADFPFISDVDRSAWLAALLTPLARFAFFGPAPLFANDGNAPSVGKTLGVSLIAVIANGRDMARTTETGDDDELRKRVTSVLLAGDSCVLIDNLSRPLGGASLDALLTAVTWRDRVLGRSAMTPELPALTVWYVTGNNLEYAGDTPRRVLPIRLRTDEEQPEKRSGFRHPDLIGYCHRHRGELLSAALTILAGYQRAGAPDQRLSPWGSYQNWSSVVRAAIVWAGMPDPALNRLSIDDSSGRDRASLGALLEALAEHFPNAQPFTAAAITQLFETRVHDPSVDGLREALEEVSNLARDQLSAAKLGWALRRVENRTVNNRRLEPAGRGRRGRLWRVVAVGPQNNTARSSDFEDLSEEEEERAAIAEFDGGLDRPAAEQLARARCGARCTKDTCDEGKQR